MPAAPRSGGALFEAISGERLEALYVLALMTGLRRGELLALRWDDIDFGSRQLRVCRVMRRVSGKLQVVEPKTSSSRRTVVPGSRCATFKSTRSGRTLSARR